MADGLLGALTGGRGEQVANELGNGGLERLLGAWPSVSERLAPLFFGDHVVAVYDPAPVVDSHPPRCPVFTASASLASSSPSPVLLGAPCSTESKCEGPEPKPRARAAGADARAL